MAVPSVFALKTGASYCSARDVGLRLLVRSDPRPHRFHGKFKNISAKAFKTLQSAGAEKSEVCFLMQRSTFSSKTSVNILEVLLNECYTTPACQRRPWRRFYTAKSRASNISNEAPNIAILGGGITGLASAYFLTRQLPKAKITLFESTSRLGGWLRSKKVDVGHGNVVFEQGPRNLRPSLPNGLMTLDLIHELGLEDRVIMTSKNSVAAQNRFLYYPDHLVRLPSPRSSLLQNFISLVTEPVFKGIVSGAFGELFKPKRPDDLEDESVGSFLSRRFGPPAADNLTSAVLHGIYAGDVYQLSVRSIMPYLWKTESRYQSIIKGAWKGAFGGPVPMADQDIKLFQDLADRPLATAKLEAIKNSSVFTFKHGIGELAETLEAKLQESPNVDIQRQTAIEKLNLDTKGPSAMINLSTCTYDSLNAIRSSNNRFTHVISTISSKNLSQIVRPAGSLSILSQTPSVTVMVVNLFYSNPSLLPVHGFGYLIPRSVSFTANPELALGVVFDSDAAIGQDDMPGTKVTVMLGGHWWDGLDSYPDEEEGASMAKALLKRHLNIAEEPQAVNVGLQKDCIPQYTVGHEQRMWKASEALERFQGRLRVAGNSYTGVGLNDCVRAAKDVVTKLVDGTGRTGLEAFVGGRKWSWVHVKPVQ